MRSAARCLRSRRCARVLDDVTLLGPQHTPYDRLGREAAVALAHRFYDHMDAHEPALVALHRSDETGHKVAAGVRESFAAFLVEWLGGPREYSSRFGHPRLRMRHAHVAVDAEMRDAWLRCMTAALEHPSVDDEVRSYLGRRFAEVAEFLRNR
jgi:hemoglobin